MAWVTPVTTHTPDRSFYNGDMNRIEGNLLELYDRYDTGSLVVEFDSGNFNETISFTLPYKIWKTQTYSPPIAEICFPLVHGMSDDGSLDLDPITSILPVSLRPTTDIYIQCALLIGDPEYVRGWCVIMVDGTVTWYPTVGAFNATGYKGFLAFIAKYPLQEI